MLQCLVDLSEKCDVHVLLETKEISASPVLLSHAEESTNVTETPGSSK